MSKWPRIVLAIPSALVVGLALSAPPAGTADWPRWLGPSQNGTSRAPGFPADDVGLRVAWRRPLGIAYSGIAVVGDRAVTMFADGEVDWVTAVNAKTGEEIWRHKIDVMFPSIGGSEGGPAGMPVVDGDVVYGLGTKGHLFALRLADGKEIWSLRIDEQLGGRPPHFGFASVPLVAGDVLFVETGGDAGRSLAGFDKRTGKLLWSVGDDKVGYQSPILATLAGQEQIVAVTNTRVLGLVPATGKILWSHEQDIAGGDDGASTPVLLNDSDFVLTGQEGAKAFRVKKSGDGWAVEERWSSTALKRSLATPVVHEGHLYGFDADFLTCVDAATGTKVWKSRPPGGRGLIVVDGHLVVFANDGSVVVAKATPEGYKEETRVSVSETGSYTYPSFAGGLIFVRNTKDIAAVTVERALPAKKETSAASAAPPSNEFERFVRKVEQTADKRLLIDDFMASRQGFPIVEDGRWVHFVYWGKATDVAVSGSMTEFQTEDPLRHVEGTDLFYRSYPIEPGTRWEYRFNVDFENLGPDPLNPRRLPGEESDLSEVATPSWKAPEHVRPYEGTERGRVSKFTLTSTILGNDRDVHVYLPADYDRGKRSYPLLVVVDGTELLERAHFPNSLDHLLGRQVAPLVVAFVGEPARGGREEMGGKKSADYVKMLADELVPRLAADHRLRTDAASRAILGAGTAATIAAYAAVERPDVFGKSGAFSAFLRPPLGPELIAAIEKGQDADRASFRVFWDRYDLRRADWDLDLARDSRKLADTLKAGGFSVESREVLDGAGWGGWRVRAAELIREWFPL